MPTIAKQEGDGLFEEMGWQVLKDAPLQDEVEPGFKVLKPIYDGNLCSPKKERMVLRHAWEMMGHIVNAERDPRLFEAAILVLAAITAAEEACACDQFSSLEDFVGYGHRFGDLFAILASVVSARILERIKNQFFRCLENNHRVRVPDPKARLLQFIALKESYSSYLNFRSSDGYFEAALYCCMAAVGESGQLLDKETTRDVIEASILLHDSHTIARHFAEEDISNLHRLTENPEASLIQAFRRSAFLYSKVRHNADIAPGLKNILCSYINSFHTFNYSCERYGYGTIYSKSIMSSINSGATLNYLQGIHHIKPDFKQSFQEMLQEYYSLNS